MSSTPSRNQHPFPPSSTSSPGFPLNPTPNLHQRTLTASSASSASFPQSPGPLGQTASLTIESLMKTHATSQDPKLAALDQAVQERNVLSSQNGQLWKLIEKQRSGYNQILKELERVRGERDNYKAKLSAVVGVSPDRRPRRENGAAPGAGTDPDIQEGSQMSSRPSADSNHTPRSNPARNQERGASQDIGTSPSFQSNSHSTPPRQKSALPPLLVPPRAETLPVPASAVSATSENAIFNSPSRYVSRNDSAPSLSTPGSRTPPHNAARTQSPLVPSSGATSDPASNGPSYPSNLQRDIQITTSPGTPIDSPSRGSPIAGPSLLNALHESRSQPLSRDSRISLPDEARQFIANMADSPASSPKTDAFAPRALPIVPTTIPATSSPLTVQNETPAEFLDMDGDGEEDAGEEADLDPEADGSQDNEEDDQRHEPSQSPVEALSRQATAAADFPLPPNVSSDAMRDLNNQAKFPQQERLYPQRGPQPYSTSPSEATAARPQLRNRASSSSSQSVGTPVGPAMPASFRALPLISTDLPTTSVTVSQSFVRPNDRGKEVLSFVVNVDPGHGKEFWKVEKMYSDVIALDQRVRNSVGKVIGKKMVSLPEGKLWKDHAPAKAVLQAYLQALVKLPVKNNDEVIAFLTSDIVRDYKQPVMQAGHKEGYLTKRGKNFGGWKTRFFVLQGPVLEYYDCRGGAHLGSIQVVGAQIGRQQRTDRTASDEEKEYRHAFLIVEAKKGPGGNHPRHVLCAESDEDRDAWVEILVRYFTGSYNEDSVSYSAAPPVQSQSQPRPSIDAVNSQARAASPARSLESSPVDRSRGQPSSLPDSSPLAAAAAQEGASYPQRASSEQGHYSDLRQHSPERPRPREGVSKGFQPTLNTVVSSPITAVPQDRAPSPEKPESKVKISGPLNGAPIPAGYKFGARDGPSTDVSTPSLSDRREKAKSRSFWGFGRPGDKDKADGKLHALPTFAPRAVFGVPLEESLDVVQIANLPAIVFRCIQYLEAKKADQEEGIYRLSGSSAVIKSLKDRFNLEGDIDLLASDEYWDPHAIAGLLKGFLRELPASILTHNLHLRFLSVIDFVDAQERIRELSQLIAALPLANYSLLRALTAHLILIVQNSSVNKMTMRNVGIVFSPTLGIPAGVFSLMLGEFNRVFNVDNEEEEELESEAPGEPNGDSDQGHQRRNSYQYSTGAADQLLGLSGRSLPGKLSRSSVNETLSLSSAAEEGTSDEDSVQYESGTETTEDAATIESTTSVSPQQPETPTIQTSPSQTDGQIPTKMSKASNTASSKGLNLNVSARSNRHSVVMGMGLPSSPRPPASPRHAQAPDAMAPAPA
ncbi:unnamed protein product [Mycena citricolor]|uniref:RhoGAP-domain-containing protein n=1 Tax=Mycena citricolor TaxID=2018698 RepID=A0AAD2H3D5_9AGAR|nr:unnamed protein product [Mycena citricolor]